MHGHPQMMVVKGQRTMKRPWSMWSVAGVIISLGLSSFLPSAGASVSETRPGPPAEVLAVSTDGVPGVTVVWKAPTPVTGPTILYYWVSNYPGKHVCMAPASGPYICRLGGLNGNIRHPIRVRAITAAGPGKAAATVSLVTHPVNPTATTSSSPSSPSGTTPSASSGVPSGDAAAVAASLTATAPVSTPGNNPAELPFTGLDVETLLLSGLSLVVVGLLLIASANQRRRTVRRIATLVQPRSIFAWLFGQ